MKLAQIIEKVETAAPLLLKEEWDNVGLMLGSKEKQVHKILAALDIDTAVAKEAIEKGVDLVLTHHPLIFNPLKTVTDFGSEASKCVLMLAKADISVYSAHTNLDCAKGGTNDFLANAYGLKNVKPLEICAEIDGEKFGIMRYGEFEKEIELEVLAKKVSKILDASGVYYVGAKNKKIKTAAICSGGGGSLLETAVSSGADVYISGDISYSKARLARESGMSIINVDHYDSEKFCVDIFKNILSDCDVEIIKSETNTNIFCRLTD